MSVASVPNARLEWKERDVPAAAQVPLQSLPFAAALVDKFGNVREANAEWLNLHPEARPDGNCFRIHDTEAKRSAWEAGLQAILDGQRAPFVQDYEQSGFHRRITASAHDGMALVLDQQLAPASEEGRQAGKMEVVGRLVGGVAHDFANLVTLIGGYGEILLNRIGDADPLRPELEEIRRAANRGARLTTQLLGFARSQAVQPKALDLNTVVEDMRRMLRPIIEEHVELQTTLNPSLDRVLADPGQMEQVVMNLILNARDAMPKGGRIRVETYNCDLDEETARQHGMASGRAVMLTISDTGHGMESGILERVFEPFFTTKEKGKGTGLGLSTVRAIIQESHGDIWVRSIPGAGTTFFVCLPRAQQPFDKPEKPVAIQTPTAGGETVLVVEDEEGVRRLLTHVLRRRGYQVLEAADGDEALRLFAERGDGIHLVLTDMVMPKMSGRELGQRLQTLRPDIRLMFMSGYTNDVLVRTGALGPGMSFLQKPLRPDTLAAKVREALDTPGRPFNPR